MNKVCFDRDWEFTKVAGFVALFHSEWQPVTMLAIVRSTGQAGEISCQAQAEGLPAAEVQLQVR